MTTHQMTIRLKGLSTEQLKTWLDMVTENSENVTHWEAKAESRDLRMTQTSEMFDGTLVHTLTKDDSVETHNHIAEGLSNMESPTELKDIPGPTFSDPDAKTIEVNDPVLPKSDHIPGPYNLDSW